MYGIKKLILKVLFSDLPITWSEGYRNIDDQRYWYSNFGKHHFEYFIT